MDKNEAALQSLILDTPDSNTAISTLANASREDPAIRAQLASPQALNALIDAVEGNLTNSLGTVNFALRCIANACADNDTAREVVTALRFVWATRCLSCSDEETVSLTTKVLFNICSDYEPAQQQCYREKIHYLLFNYCSSDFASTGAAGSSHAIDLLFWISGQKAALEPELAEPLPTEVTESLLTLPQRYAHVVDAETYGCLLEAALVFLRDSTLQDHLKSSSLAAIMDMLKQTDIKARATVDPEDLKILDPLCVSLTWCLSDIATKAQPSEDAAFGGVFQLFVQSVREYGLLDSARIDVCNKTMLTAACEVLGNLLWNMPSDSAAPLVESSELDQILFQSIVHMADGPASAVAMHSVSGLLMHLTRPGEEVREKMGSRKDAQSALERLCQYDMPQIKQDGIRLLRALGKECSTNQQRFADLGREVMANGLGPSPQAVDRRSPQAVDRS